MSADNLDLFRWFILTQAALVVAATVFIWVRYTIGIVRCPDQPRVWHIVTISSSYAAAIIYIALTTIERFGTGYTWRIPLAGFVFIAGDAGLCFMLAHLYSHRVYAKTTRERLLREEIASTEANTKATESNTAAICRTDAPIEESK